MAQMDDERLFALVEAARERAASSAAPDVAESFVEVLRELSADEVAAADVACVRVLGTAYSWDLWGAAYLLNGGCSDDAFFYFRGWLLTRGRLIWDAALADPDSLATVVLASELGELESEDMTSAPWEAHAHLTVQENLPDDLEYADEPELGAGWDFEDDEEMARRYPRIWALVRPPN